jgi:3,4-dihydroxyphenylacetate 2,3-dioxygenase
VLIPFVLLAPHRPTLLQDQSRGHKTPMLAALAAAKERLLEAAPAALVVVSARWESNGPLLADAGRRHRTIIDFHGFGSDLRYDCPGKPSLARTLVEAGLAAGLSVGEAVRGIDSGAAVPLHFLSPSRGVPVVPLSLAPQPAAEHRRWGAVVRRTLDKLPESVAFVVGGGLSNNEHAFNLRRDVPEAAAFDEQALAAIERGDWQRLLATPERRVVERAQPEAGLRHLEILRGFLGHDAAGARLAYEPGPGVGAALVEFPATVESPVRAESSG